jgi:hypothetical protein
MERNSPSSGITFVWLAQAQRTIRIREIRRMSDNHPPRSTGGDFTYLPLPADGDSPAPTRGFFQRKPFAIHPRSSEQGILASRQVYRQAYRTGSSAFMKIEDESAEPQARLISDKAKLGLRNGF